MTTTEVTAQRDAPVTTFAMGLALMAASRERSGRLHPVVAFTTSTTWVAVRSARITTILYAPLPLVVSLKPQAPPTSPSQAVAVVVHHTLKTTQLYLDDYSYAITYLISSEWTRFGNIGGWFEVIRDITIYLKDINDRKVLQEAKRMIKMIDKYSKKINFSSFRQYLSTSIVEGNDHDFEGVKKNIYILKRDK